MPPSKRIVPCCVALALLAGSSLIHAQLYKYRDASGAWVYTDRQPPAGAHQLIGHSVAADQHQDPLAGDPGASDPGPAHGPHQLVVDHLGGAA